MAVAHILRQKGTSVVTVEPGDSVQTIVDMLARHRIGAVVVVDRAGGIAGIVSERDVVRAMTHGPESLTRPVAAIMTTHVFCAPPEAHIDELMHVMTEKRVRHIPVTDPDGVLLGIVSIGDVVKSRLGELEGERSALLEYITKG